MSSNAKINKQICLRPVNLSISGIHSPILQEMMLHPFYVSLSKKLPLNDDCFRISRTKTDRRTNLCDIYGCDIQYQMPRLLQWRSKVLGPFQ